MGSINNLWLGLLPVLGFIYLIIFSFKWDCSDKYLWRTPLAWNITNIAYGLYHSNENFPHRVPHPLTRLFIGEVQILKNHGRVDQDIFVKVGGNPYRGFSIEGGGGKHYFSLMMYRFCSNNALYSRSLSFTMLFLTTFSAWGCCYFQSNLSLVWYVKELLITKRMQRCFVVFWECRNKFLS